MNGDSSQNAPVVSFREQATSRRVDGFRIEHKHIIEVLRPATPPGFSGGLECEMGRIRWHVVQRIGCVFHQRAIEGEERHPEDHVAAEQAKARAWKGLREWLDEVTR